MFKKALLIVILGLGFILNSQAQTWELDVTHMNVGFSVDHMAISEVTGRFTRASGSLKSAKEDLADASGEISIDVSSVNTDNADRDKHLQAEDFFDVAKHPKMVFKINSLKKAGASAYIVSGQLTIKGITKPLTLTGRFSGLKKDPWGNMRAGFIRMETQINRKDFGLSFSKTLDGGGLLVGDEVRIQISAEFIKKG